MGRSQFSVAVPFFLEQSITDCNPNTNSNVTLNSGAGYTQSGGYVFAGKFPATSAVSDGAIISPGTITNKVAVEFTLDSDRAPFRPSVDFSVNSGTITDVELYDVDNSTVRDSDTPGSASFTFEPTYYCRPGVTYQFRLSSGAAVSYNNRSDTLPNSTVALVSFSGGVNDKTHMLDSFDGVNIGNLGKMTIDAPCADANTYDSLVFDTSGGSGETWAFEVDGVEQQTGITTRGFDLSGVSAGSNEKLIFRIDRSSDPYAYTELTYAGVRYEP